MARRALSRLVDRAAGHCPPFVHKPAWPVTTEVEDVDMMRSLVWALVAVCGLVLAGCSAPSDSASSGDGTAGAAKANVVTLSRYADPKTLDPSLCTDIASATIIYHLFEPLARLDMSGQPQPAGAASWEHSPDYKTWTFKLRPEAKWSNGEPVVAEDYLYALRRILTKRTNSQYASMVYNFLQGGREFYESDGSDTANFGARAIDTHTLEIKLLHPSPFFLSVIVHSSWYPLNKAAIEGAGERWALAPETLVGNGPFALEALLPKDRVIVKRNTHYWDATSIKLDQVVFKTIENESTEMAAFEAGDVDITSRVSPVEAKSWVDRPEFSRNPVVGTYYVGFNLTAPPFDDVRVRRAFSIGINRPLITERLTKLGEVPSRGFVPTGVKLPDGRDYTAVAPAYLDNKDFTTASAESKKLLAEAGFGPGGKPMPRLEYSYNEGELHRAIGENLQMVWKESTGADVSLVVMEWGELLDKATALDYQLMRRSWVGDYMDPMTFLEIFRSDDGNNNFGYKSAEYDAMIDAARSEADPAKRLELLIACEKKIVQEDVVVAPVFEQALNVLQRTDVKNVIINYSGVVDASRAYRVAK